MTKVKQKVKIKERITSDTRISLNLDWHKNGKRKRESLGIHIYRKPVGPMQRQHNKDEWIRAEHIRMQRESQYFSDEIDDVLQIKAKKNSDFMEFVESYIKAYKQKDNRVMNAVIKQLKEFNGDYVSFRQIDEAFCVNFRDFLVNKFKGETPATYFSRFKKIITQATREKYFSINPALNVRNLAIKDEILKDVLELGELLALIKTPCPNQIVRNAFLFCCNTGLRFCDIKELKWSEISDNGLKTRQNKTRNWVEVQLNKNALKYLPDKTNNSELIYNLPSNNGTNKTLNKWCEKAGLKKHITFHCARHTFGTLLAYHDNDVSIISKLLGHSSLSYTMRYIRIADEMKQKAVDSIPEF